MKYAFMSFSCPELTLPQALRQAEELGYEGFEPRIDAGHKHGIELNMDAAAVAETKRVQAASPVKLCCLASSIKLAVASQQEKTVEDALRAAHLCAELDIPVIRVFGGKPDPDISREAATEQVIQTLRTLDEKMAGLPVTLCMESHDFWCEPDYILPIMQACGGEHVAVNWDMMHPVLTAKRPISYGFEVLKPYIRHVHMHDGYHDEKGNLFFKPFGKGRIDTLSGLALLKATGYDGFISGEWIGWDEPDYLRTEMATLKHYEEVLQCSK